MPTLTDYITGDAIRPATREEWQRSKDAVITEPGGAGTFILDGRIVFVSGDFPTSAPTAHTPEPWSAHDRDVSGRTRDGYPTAIAECWDTAVSEDEDRANAVRIVAAVNACAGITDPGPTLASIAGFLEDVVNGCDPDEARTIAAELLALLGAK